MSVFRALHVVVAGGGVAATEAMFLLRDHAGARVRITVVAPEEDDVAPRVLPLVEPFAAGSPSRRMLPLLARDAGAELVRGRVVGVDGHRRRVRLDGGRTLAYDALVLAVGASARPVIHSALTLFGDAGGLAVERVLVELHGGHAPSLDLVIPAGMTRSLALYELAVGVATEVRIRRLDAKLRILSPERTPGACFEPGARAALRALLADAGIAFAGSSSVVEGLDGLRRVNDVATMVRGARTVALPVLDGPSLSGAPATADGFLPVDEYGAVPGLGDVYAAGDATACPVKHIDVACAQAAAIARVVAQQAGAAVRAAPWRAVVRDHLLGDHGIGALALAGDPAAVVRGVRDIDADADPGADTDPAPQGGR